MARVRRAVISNDEYLYFVIPGSLKDSIQQAKDTMESSDTYHEWAVSPSGWVCFRVLREEETQLPIIPRPHREGRAHGFRLPKRSELDLAYAYLMDENPIPAIYERWTVGAVQKPTAERVQSISNQTRRVRRRAKSS